MTDKEIIEMARQAGVRDDEHIFEFSQFKYLERFAKLVADYVAPQRTWVGLTRMELIKCGVFPWGNSYELYEAIETKLKEKNT
jgi:hypothetical protein